MSRSFADAIMLCQATIHRAIDSEDPNIARFTRRDFNSQHTLKITQVNNVVRAAALYDTGPEDHSEDRPALEYWRRVNGLMVTCTREEYRNWQE